MEKREFFFNFSFIVKFYIWNKWHNNNNWWQDVAWSDCGDQLPGEDNTKAGLPWENILPATGDTVLTNILLS